MRNTVEVALEVSIHHPTISLVEQSLDSLDRLSSVALRPKPIALLGKLPLKDGSNTYSSAVCTTRSRTTGTPSGRLSPVPAWYPDPFDRLGHVAFFRNCRLRPPMISLRWASKASQLSPSTGTRPCRSPLAASSRFSASDLIYQTMPFASAIPLRGCSMRSSYALDQRELSPSTPCAPLQIAQTLAFRASRGARPTNQAATDEDRLRPSL